MRRIQNVRTGLRTNFGEERNEKYERQIYHKKKKITREDSKTN